MSQDLAPKEMHLLMKQIYDVEEDVYVRNPSKLRLMSALSLLNEKQNGDLVGRTLEVYMETLNTLLQIVLTDQEIEELQATTKGKNIYDDMSHDLSYLRGEALVVPHQGEIIVLGVDSLKLGFNVKKRLQKLFELKDRFSQLELEPYFEGFLIDYKRGMQDFIK